MDLDQIQNMLMSEYNTNSPANDYVSSATAGINQQTRKRVQDLLGKFSSTGMGRSGISGAAENDIYSNAGQNISQVNAKGEEMTQNNHMQVLSQLLGLSEYQDSKPGFGDVLGAVGGKLLGGATGGLGSALGGGLANLLGSGAPK
jgi:hypothetical protein